LLIGMMRRNAPHLAPILPTDEDTLLHPRGARTTNESNESQFRDAPIIDLIQFCAADEQKGPKTLAVEARILGMDGAEAGTSPYLDDDAPK